MRVPEENGKNKRKIMDTARELYYERGMDGVSFDEIAERCGVTKSLIRYHFGSKAQLANELFGVYSKEQANVFFEKAYALGNRYSNIDIVAAYTVMSCRYYCTDEKALRFYTQFYSCSFTELTSGIEDMYRIPTPREVEPDVAHMTYIGSQYAARGLIYHFATGEIKCSEETLDRYILNLSMGNLYTAEEIDGFLQAALEILGKVEVAFLPGFTWK